MDKGLKKWVGVFRSEPRSIWIAMGVLALLIRVLFDIFPSLAEKLYSRGLYLGIRWLFDHTLGLLPFPAVYLAGGLLLSGILIVLIRKLWLPRLKRTWKQRLGSASLTLGAWAGGFVFFFYFLWGYHYFRVPLEEQMGLPMHSLSPEEIAADARVAADLAIDLRQQIPGAGADSVWATSLPQGYEKILRGHMEEVMGDYGYPRTGRVRVRHLQPPGTLIGMGISGIYIPFAGEGCVEASLPPVEMAFTTAHEMAHGYGFADEGSANFIAFLTLQRAREPFLRYAGIVSWYRYVSSEYRLTDPAGYMHMRDSLPETFRADLRVIRRYYQARHSWVSEATSQINDTYLQSQGVKEGARSYDRMVELVNAWRRKHTAGAGGAYALPHAWRQD